MGSEPIVVNQPASSPVAAPTGLPIRDQGDSSLRLVPRALRWRGAVHVAAILPLLGVVIAALAAARATILFRGPDRPEVIENPLLWSMFAVALSAAATYVRPGESHWIEPVSRPPLASRQRLVGAVALLLGGVVIVSYALRPLPAWALVAGWLLAQVGWVGAFVSGPPSWRTWRSSPRPMLLEGAGLVAMLAVATWMRVWNAPSMPLDVHGDTASWGLQARALLAGEYRDVFGAGWAGIPLVAYWPTALALRFVGDDLTGLNAVGAAAGVASLLGLYLLTRDLCGRRTAFLATILALGDLHHLHYSRFAQYIEPVPIVVWGLFFFLRGVRKGWNWAFAAAGLLGGLGLLTYYSGRLLIPLLGVSLLISALFSPRAVWHRRWGIGVCAVGVLLALGPNLAYWIKNPGDFSERTRQVSVFGEGAWRHTASKYNLNPADGPRIILEQVERSLLSFWQFSDNATQFGIERNTLQPIAGTLLILGLGLIVAGFRRPVLLLLAAWLFGYVASASLTVDPPPSMRMVGVALPIALIGALAVDRTIALLLRGRGATVFGVAIATSLVFTPGVLNWQEYLAWASNPRTAGPRTQIARFLMDQSPTYEIRIVSQQVDWNVRELQFLVPGRAGANLKPDALASGQVEWPTGPAIFILTPDSRALSEHLKGRYPDGRLVDGSLPPRREVFWAFFTHADMAECCDDLVTSTTPPIASPPAPEAEPAAAVPERGAGTPAGTVQARPAQAQCPPTPSDRASQAPRARLSSPPSKPRGAAAMNSFDHLPVFLDDTSVRQASSFDREGENIDGSAYFLYRHPKTGGYVVLEEYKPGTIYRIWSTGIQRGRIRLYFDGQSSPAVDLDLFEFFSGATPPFLFPLVGNDLVSSGGFFSYYPFSFRESIRVEFTEVPIFYQFTYHLYTSSDGVTTFTGREDLQAAYSAWQDPSRNPYTPSATDVTSRQSIATRPGETVTLLDATDQGTVRSILLTLPQLVPTQIAQPPGADLSAPPAPIQGRFNPATFDVLNRARLQLYWDDDVTPSVDLPLGFFFGLGSSGMGRVGALLVGVDPISNTFYNYFPMPFGSRARIILANLSQTPIEGATAEVRYSRDAVPGLGSRAGYFTAAHRVEAPTTPGRDYVFLDIPSGRGQLVATIQSISRYPHGGILEGDERIFIDTREFNPELHGTGVEDYYNGGWYFNKGLFTLPTHGNPLTHGMDGTARTSMYRLSLMDALPFENSILFRMEHGLINNNVDANFESAVFAYVARDKPSLVQTDRLKIGDPSDERNHSYEICGETGRRAFDGAFSGRDDGGRASGTVRTHVGSSSFNVSINPNNSGVRLGRILDFSVRNQMARVFVNDYLVGIWFTGGDNPSYPAHFDYFEIPETLTRGEQRLRIRIESVTPEPGWTEVEYLVFSHLSP